MILSKRNDSFEYELFNSYQKIDLENSMYQSFATLSKLLTFRYICATSEGGGQSKSFALSKIYNI